MTGWNCHAGVEDRCKVRRPSCASSRTERRYLNPTGLSPTSCPATSRPYDRGLFHLLCVFARQPQRLIVVIDCRVNNPKVRFCALHRRQVISHRSWKPLDLVVPPAMLRLRGLALAYRRRRTLLLAKLAQNAAREQNAPLPWRELGEESYLLVSSPQWDLLVTVLQAFAQVRKFPLVALLELLVVRLVCELQGENALGDQIPPVDASEALSYHRSDAEVQRGQGRVLAATTLTVVVPANDKARRHLLGLLVVLRVEAAEGETGDLGHVRAERHYLHPIWREVSSRDVVPDDDGHGALE